MPDSERLVRFHLLGQDFAFYTGASEEEMEMILGIVRQHVEDSGCDPGRAVQVSKVAVMACLNLASRYVRLRHDFEEYREDTEARIEALNEKIEKHFFPEK